jgi:alkylhydroperoxidase family enzyme
MSNDPYAEIRDQVLERVIRGPAESDSGIRAAAADGKGAPADLQPLIDKIHRHAYKVTDEDVARAQAKYGDDRMFEIVVSAALGASRNRLRAGLKALSEA